MKRQLATQIIVMLTVFGSACSASLAGEKCSSPMKTVTEAESTLPKISRAELQEKINKVRLVDALDNKYFLRSRIKGSVNIPMGSAAKLAFKFIPSKDTEIVVYCMNTKCHTSDRVADELAKVGYTKVSIYRAGLQDWISAGLPLEGKNPKEPIPPTKTAGK